MKGAGFIIIIVIITLYDTIFFFSKSGSLFVRRSYIHVVSHKYIYRYIYVYAFIYIYIYISGMRCGLQGQLQQTFWPRVQTPRPRFVRANLTRG